MAKRKTTLRGPDLTRFLADVRRLEAKGFLRKTDKRGRAKATRYRIKKVKDLSEVLASGLSGVKRSPKILREFKDAGFVVSNGRVGFKPEIARKVRRSKPNEYPSFIQRPEGRKSGPTIERIQLPVKIDNIEKFKRFAASGKLDALKEPHDYFAFTYFGSNSHRPFLDVQEMLEYLEEYDTFDDAYSDVWDNFELFRVYPPGVWGPTPRRKKYSTTQDRRDASKKGWRRRKRAGFKKSSAVKEAKRVSDRIRMRELRAKEYAGRSANGETLRGDANKPRK